MNQVKAIGGWSFAAMETPIFALPSLIGISGCQQEFPFCSMDYKLSARTQLFSLCNRQKGREGVEDRGCRRQKGKELEVCEQHCFFKPLRVCLSATMRQKGKASGFPLPPQWDFSTPVPAEKVSGRLRALTHSISAPARQMDKDSGFLD